VFANVGRALRAAGAGPDQVAVFGDHKPADALIGVETLSRPEYLIEVEAFAVI
jgi:enamine deaminase RidA (YjgF/YER057c/UK114 family)